MYSPNLILINQLGTNFALSNKFKNIPLLQLEIKECVDPYEVEIVVNRYASYGNWKVKVEGRDSLLLEYKDLLNNIYYLIIKNT